ncbi:MAG: sensor histidine kinase [Acidobacteriota bacterium]
MTTHGAAWGWELNVPLACGLSPLYFAGWKAGEGYVLVASLSRRGLARRGESLLAEAPPEGYLVALALAGEAVRETARAAGDSFIYDDLTRLNNELADLQREVARKNAELLRLNEEKNRFLGMAAHDLRGPLSTILAYSRFLLEEDPPPEEEERRAFLKTIQGVSRLMLVLVEDLLDVAKIEAGRLDLNCEPTDLALLTAGCCAQQNALSAGKGVRIEVEAGRGLPLLDLDRPRFSQVLHNLLSNAVKFSHPGSLVVVSLQREGDFVVLAVRDRGVGIPVQDLDRLFRPFGRTGAKAPGGEKSTGLGLAIVHKIVEAHGGAVEARNNDPGPGATFTVRLPLKKD